MLQQTVHIAVDMMSGDSGLRVTLPAALQVLQAHSLGHLHLVGDEKLLTTALAQWPEDLRARVTLVHAPDLMVTDDRPSAVLRKTDQTSIRVALEALAQGRVNAVVSAGNAGELMILARKLIGMLQPSTRPAFCSLFPTKARPSLLLDLGANVDSQAPQLCTFARLGSALYLTLFPLSPPRVALLSNGEEAAKGNLQVRCAAGILAKTPDINYVGYIEANALHDGLADVVVCDGFVGNIALKAIEGTAALAVEKLEELLSCDGGSGVTEEQRERLLADFTAALDPEIHNGAFLLGLAGIVIKAHGGSSVEGFAASIRQALQCEEQGMITKMQAQLVATKP
ncbi:MAG: phosphate acyltransferase PlsX [Halioglobus sp.]